MPLPAGLPAPVERFYRQLDGDQVPVIESAVITGHAAMSPVGGLKLPARFRFVHQVGQDYHHYFELTWFGRTIGTGNERYLDGKSRLALPMGLSDEDPQVDQAANLSLWAEYVWLPAVFLTDPRVRWEPVDEQTALLVVSFGDQFERFVARFDPVIGRLHMLEAMRYKDSKSAAKTLWLNESQNWDTVRASRFPRPARSPGSTRAGHGPSLPWKTSSSTWMCRSCCARVVNRTQAVVRRLGSEARSQPAPSKRSL